MVKFFTVTGTQRLRAVKTIVKRNKLDGRREATLALSKDKSKALGGKQGHLQSLSLPAAALRPEPWPQFSTPRRTRKNKFIKSF